MIIVARRGALPMYAQYADPTSITQQGMPARNEKIPVRGQHESSDPEDPSSITNNDTKMFTMRKKLATFRKVNLRSVLD